LERQEEAMTAAENLLNLVSGDFADSFLHEALPITYYRLPIPATEHLSRARREILTGSCKKAKIGSFFLPACDKLIAPRMNLD
jgi:hypothetical protein